MIDVNKLLTAVLAGSTPGSEQPAPWGSGTSVPVTRRAGTPQGGSPPVGLPESLGRIVGGGGGGGGLGEFLKNPGVLTSGALAGGVAGLLLNSKSARKLAGTALQVGAAAVIGGLAYKAYQDYRAGRPIVPQGVQDLIKGMLGQPAQDAARSAPADLADQSQQRVATLLLRAMIAAAMADGRIDEVERRRLIDHVEASAMSEEERHYLEALMAKPDAPAALAADVASPEEGAQVYFAAYVAIDADTPEEKAWLEELAKALRIESALRTNLEAAGQQAMAQAA